MGSSTNRSTPRKKRNGMVFACGVCLLLGGGCGSNDPGPALPKAVQARLPTDAYTLVSRLCSEDRSSGVRRQATATARRQLRGLLLQLNRAPNAKVTVNFLYTDKVDPVPRTMSVRELAALEADAPDPGIPGRLACHKRYRKILRRALSNSG